MLLFGHSTLFQECQQICASSITFLELVHQPWEALCKLRHLFLRSGKQLCLLVGSASYRYNRFPWLQRTAFKVREPSLTVLEYSQRGRN